MTKSSYQSYRPQYRCHFCGNTEHHGFWREKGQDLSVCKTCWYKRGSFEEMNRERESRGQPRKRENHREEKCKCGSRDLHAMHREENGQYTHYCKKCWYKRY